MGFFSWIFKNNEKKKVLGLALGSGGAKGFAHLGALKAFEENGVEFDVISGTSIGSIVGAFYADGYTSTDVYEMISSIDVGEIANKFMINMDTSKLFTIIDRSIGSKNIEELKKPFRAIATDMEKGTEKVFDSGSVAKALCASSSYPPFFKPVVIDDRRYVDGAYTNSLPADVVKGLKADYIVAIDLSTHENKSNTLQKFFPTFKGGVKEPWAKGYEYADVVLKPDLTGYNSTSFFSARQIYDIGYSTAILNMPKILEGIKGQTKKTGLLAFKRIKKDNKD